MANKTTQTEAVNVTFPSVAIAQRFLKQNKIKKGEILAGSIEEAEFTLPQYFTVNVEECIEKSSMETVMVEVDEVEDMEAELYFDAEPQL